MAAVPVPHVGSRPRRAVVSRRRDRRLRAPGPEVQVASASPSTDPVLGLGLVAVASPSCSWCPALPGPPGARCRRRALLRASGCRRRSPRRGPDFSAAPVLIGLFGLAVALGTLDGSGLGRPPAFASRSVGTAAVAAAAPSWSITCRPRRCWPARRPTSLRTVDRAEPRAQPVRDRFAGLLALASSGSDAGKPDRRSPRRAGSGR